MSHETNPIIETYSQLAENYDAEKNLSSCWGRATEAATATIALREGYLTMAADRMPTFLNTARNALMLIGLKREARQVPDVTEYLRKAAEDGSGSTNRDDRGLPLVVDGEATTEDDA